VKEGVNKDFTEQVLLSWESGRPNTPFNLGLSTVFVDPPTTGRIIETFDQGETLA
jgi:hypothetical protein